MQHLLWRPSGFTNLDWRALNIFRPLLHGNGLRSDSRALSHHVSLLDVPCTTV